MSHDHKHDDKHDHKHQDNKHQGQKDTEGVSPKSGKHHHRAEAAAQVSVVVVTVSDTRTLETDTGGALVAEMLEAADHKVHGRQVVKDEPEAIAKAAREGLVAEGVGALIFTGGTGVAPRDVTPESIEPLLERTIPGFGEIFRQLSYEEIGSAALLSRATAGLAQGRVVFVIPGSRGAVRLAMEKLIVPELGHLAAEAVKTR
jgi:molybdenum cofactor biosynthesis protein B